MCGRFDTSHLTWADIHRQLSTLLPVTSAPMNLQANDDVRPTTSQAVARIEDRGFIVEPMRWSFLPHYWNGKPIKDTEKGKGDGFKLTTFNSSCLDVASSCFRWRAKSSPGPSSAPIATTSQRPQPLNERVAPSCGWPLNAVLRGGPYPGLHLASEAIKRDHVRPQDASYFDTSAAAPF